MNYEISSSGTSTEISISGQITASDHDQFLEILKLFKVGHDAVIFDLAGVEFMDAGALEMLIMAYEHAIKQNMAFEVRNAKGQVARMLQISKFDVLFNAG